MIIEMIIETVSEADFSVGTYLWACKELTELKNMPQSEQSLDPMTFSPSCTCLTWVWSLFFEAKRFSSGQRSQTNCLCSYDTWEVSCMASRNLQNGLDLALNIVQNYRRMPLSKFPITETTFEDKFILLSVHSCHVPPVGCGVKLLLADLLREIWRNSKIH